MRRMIVLVFPLAACLTSEDLFVDPGVDAYLDGWPAPQSAHDTDISLSDFRTGGAAATGV